MLFLPDAVLLYKCARWVVMLFLLVRLDEKCRGCLRRSWQAGRHRIYDSRAKRRTAQRVANVSRHARSRLAQWRLGVGGGGLCERMWCYGRSCTSEGGCFLAATTTVMMCQATNTGPTIKARMDRVSVNRGARQPLCVAQLHADPIPKSVCRPWPLWHLFQGCQPQRPRHLTTDVKERQENLLL